MLVANNIPATKLYKSTVYIQNKIWLSEDLRIKGEEYGKWESKRGRSRGEDGKSCRQDDSDENTKSIKPQETHQCLDSIRVTGRFFFFFSYPFTCTSGYRTPRSTNYTIYSTYLVI